MLEPIYPMSKKRDVGANWFELPFEERRRLMGGHARSGKPHQPNILQLITGATGWDDWEWGVTLLRGLRPILGRNDDGAGRRLQALRPQPLTKAQIVIDRSIFCPDSPLTRPLTCAH